jgi:hypothetical protein
MSDVTVSLGVTGKDAVLGAFKQVSGSAQKLAGQVAGIGLAYFSVKGIADQFAKSIEIGGKLVDISAKTGIGAGALYDLGEAGRSAGLSIEDISSAVNKLQKGLGSSESNSVLSQLGIDGSSLANGKPEEAFKKIGLAIAGIKNPTEQVQAALALFGKSGAQMLQLFNDPSFKAGIGSSQAGQLFEKNAGVFDRFGDSLGRIKPKINEFFTGFNSENASSMERIADAMERLDLTQSGVSAGSVVATFIEAFSTGNLGELLSLSMQIAASKFINNIVGGALFMGRILWETISAIFNPETWKGFGNLLLSFVNSINAALMDGIALLLRQLERAPVIGKYFSAAASSTSALGASYSALSAQQSNSSLGSFQSVIQPIIKKSFESFNWGEILKTGDLESSLSQLTDSLSAGLNKANDEAQKNNSMRPNSGSYDSLTSKASIIADSLAKVGGGGNAIGPGGNPLLEENRQQTAIMKSMNQHLSTMSRSSMWAGGDAAEAKFNTTG